MRKPILSRDEFVQEIESNFANVERALRTGEATPELVNFSIRLTGADAAIWRALLNLCNMGSEAVTSKQILKVGIKESFNNLFADAFRHFLRGERKYKGGNGE